MKIMIINYKIKQKPKTITILGVIGNLVLDFIPYFVTVYVLYDKVPYTCNMRTG